MASDIDRELDGEVTRTEVVRYFQGALGHATAGLLFLLLAGFLQVVGYPNFGWIAVVGSVLVSANGLSIWAWDGLREYFAARTGTDDSESTRTLQAQPFSAESRVEMKSGAVMVFLLVGTLTLTEFALRFVDLGVVGAVYVAVLAVGNTAALARRVVGR